MSAYGIYLSYQKCLKEKDTLSLKDIYLNISSRVIKLLAGFWFVFAALWVYSFAVERGTRFVHVYGHGIKSVLYFLIDFMGLAHFLKTPTLIFTFWYISLALIIIFLMPLLITFQRRFGSLVLMFCAVLFAVLFPVTTKHTMTYLPMYLFCVCLGLVAADKNWIIAFSGLGERSALWCRGLKALAILAAAALSLFFRQSTPYATLRPIWDGVLPFLIIAFMFEFVNGVTVLGRILHFLGVHSMNIFLIHDFIRVVWFYRFTYSFKYAPLIVLVLLCESALCSVAVERLKGFVRYGRFVDWLLVTARTKIDTYFAE